MKLKIGAMVLASLTLHASEPVQITEKPFKVHMKKTHISRVVRQWSFEEKHLGEPQNDGFTDAVRSLIKAKKNAETKGAKSQIAE
jgi:hypothetical protein